MIEYELEQEYLYDNNKYIVCCTIHYDVTGQHLPATREEPEEFPDINVMKVTVDAILVPTTDTMDSKTVCTERKLSQFDPLYSKIEHEFILDDEWMLQDEVEDKLYAYYKERSSDWDT